MAEAEVFFTKDISPAGLKKAYEALGVQLTGKIGVKVSTGEQGARGYLKKELIAPFVQSLNGAIIECNTSYPGARTKTAEHLKVAEAHGFMDFAEVDIMDAEGEMKIPVKNGQHLEYDIVGTHLDDYDAMVNLAHGKGHMMGGFGANLKNQSIGVASRHGKAYIHSCGHTDNPILCWQHKHAQKDFIESMAESAKAVADYFAEKGKPIVYITVANAISVDCDCDSKQGDPVIGDIGIFASLDPVANDQAFLDAIWATEEPGTAAIKERIESREGRHITEYAESLGLGSTKYRLVSLD